MLVRKRIFSPVLTPALLAGILALGGCTAAPESANSLSTTSVDQTSVKKQSIGNCWAYAVASWAESLHLSATGEAIDISESYISYWSFYYELLENTTTTAIETGGSWDLAKNITLTHGWLSEGEFIPEEAGVDFSTRQKHAKDFINAELQPGGRLGAAELRTQDNITAVLNAAFGVDIATVSAAARRAQSLVTGENNSSLYDLLTSASGQWTTTQNPQEYGAATLSPATQESRMQLIRRAQRALNDRLPVLISFMVGWGALDPTDGQFTYEMYASNGLGDQGGHMVVLHDYVVDNVPGYGTVGEGEVAPEIKEAALQGDIRYFVVKNSWGTNRPERGLTDGYSRLGFGYLNENLPWDYSGEKINSSALIEVILPPGY